MARYDCRGCGNTIAFCECADRRAAAASVYTQDGGYAFWEGRNVYWDKDDSLGNVINIFPDGMPPRSHGTHDHDHIKVSGASVSTVGGTTYIVGGYVSWSRINGVER